MNLPLLPLGKDIRLIPLYRKQSYRIAPNKLVIHERTGIRLISKDQIVYCKSDSNYTCIYLKTKEKIVLSKCLKKVEQSLSGANFQRIHASYLINLDYLEKINFSPSKSVLLEDGNILPISRSRFSELTNLFSENSKF